MYIAGALLTAALIFLGALWPTLFSVFAVIAIPAPGIFVIAAVKPQTVSKIRFVRFYLWVCVLLSIGSWIAQISWLAR